MSLVDYITNTDHHGYEKNISFNGLMANWKHENQFSCKSISKHYIKQTLHTPFYIKYYMYFLRAYSIFMVFLLKIASKKENHSSVRDDGSSVCS